MDQMLHLSGLYPVHDYGFYCGDCFFDTIEWLTGVPSHLVRLLSMKQLRHDLSILKDSALDSFGHILKNTRDPNNAIYNMNVTHYIERMSLTCRSKDPLALWADLVAVQFTCECLTNAIVKHQYDVDGKKFNTVRFTPYAVPPNTTLTEYHVLFTGPEQGGH